MKNSRKKNQRIKLPGGCSMSVPSIHPANWKTVSASVRKDWYIHYRFYDPVNRPAGKQRILKGMNDQHKPDARRIATESLLADELADLRNGFNPVTKTWLPAELMNGATDISEDTPFPLALKIAETLIEGATSTRDDIRAMLNWIPLGIAKAQLLALPVSMVKEKHVLKVLDQCSRIRSRYDEKLQKTITCGWSTHKYNKYRGYLMMLFRRIKKTGAIEVNPIRDLEKEKDKSVKKPRLTLTKDERKRVDQHLRDEYYTFWRFLHIFFHSGSRETEMMALKGKDVDLVAGTFNRVVKKDSVYREVATPIKDIALPLWMEAMEGCGQEDYVFSWGYVPGIKPMSSRNVAKTWKKKVKNPLGIKADFYSLKHLNTTETTELADAETAARQNAHQSTAMVVKIYDVNRKKREDEKLKKVNNPFV